MVNATRDNSHFHGSRKVTKLLHEIEAKVVHEQLGQLENWK